MSRSEYRWNTRIQVCPGDPGPEGPWPEGDTGCNRPGDRVQDRQLAVNPWTPIYFFPVPPHRQVDVNPVSRAFSPLGSTTLFPLLSTLFFNHPSRVIMAFLAFLRQGWQNVLISKIINSLLFCRHPETTL